MQSRDRLGTTKKKGGYRKAQFTALVRTDPSVAASDLHAAWQATLSARQAAKLLGVSRRTFFRCVEFLRSLGFDVGSSSNPGIDTGILRSVTTEAEVKPLTTAEFVALRDRIKAKGYKGIGEAERDDLLKRTKNGERLAQNLFVLLHERVVELILSKYIRRMCGLRNIDIQEAMQEGRLAILRAVENYDSSVGTFSNYLFWHLRSCNRFNNSGDPMIWMGPLAFSRGKRIEKDETGCLIDVVGLDESIGDEDTSTVEEMIPAEGQTPEEEFANLQATHALLSAIRVATTNLTDRERFVIEKRFGEDALTLEEVGQLLGLTREGARFVEGKALEKIRVHLRREGFDFAKIESLLGKGVSNDR